MRRYFLVRFDSMWILIMLLCMTGEAFAESSVADLCGVPLPSIVAKVNDSEILRAEVFLRLGDITTLSQDQRRSRCRGAAEEAIRAILITPEAESYQVWVEPEEVEAKLNGFKASFSSEEALEGFLAERQADISSLMKVIRDSLLLERFEEREIRSWVFSEELQQEYFNEHRSELAKDRIKASHILVKTKKEAEQILLERNLKNLSFSELAVKYSLDENTRQQGGDLGWIEKGKMSPEFDAAAFSLEIGSISKPVKTPLGYHLILIEDKKPASEQTLEDHRARVIRLLQEKEWAYQQEAWWKETEAKASIWITPELNLVSQNSERKEIRAGHE